MFIEENLGAICDRGNGKIQTGPFGSQLHEADYVEDGLPVIMPKDIVNGQIVNETVARISEEKSYELSRHKLKQGAIVMPRRGEINKRAFITEKEEGWLCGTGCIKVELKGEELFPKFFYYYLHQPLIVGWIEKKAVGTTMLNLNTSIIRNIPIKRPPIETQKRIAEILSAYDDLIENNLKRIRLLEESARLLYREWFVRLKFPNHEHTLLIDGLPEGWERAKVGELIESIKRKKKIPKDEYLESGEIPCVDQSTEFIGGFTDDEESRHTEPLPIIVFGDHTRSLKYIDFPFASGADGTQLIYPNRTELSPIYFFFALKEIDLSNYFYARHFKFLKDQEILVATEKLINEFSDFANKNFEQIKNLKNQNQKLKQARDLLLPRLMSGEIAV